MVSRNLQTEKGSMSSSNHQWQWNHSSPCDQLAPTPASSHQSMEVSVSSFVCRGIHFQPQYCRLLGVNRPVAAPESSGQTDLTSESEANKGAVVIQQRRTRKIMSSEA